MPLFFVGHYVNGVLSNVVQETWSDKESLTRSIDQSNRNIANVNASVFYKEIPISCVKKVFGNFLWKAYFPQKWPKQ